MKNDYYWEQNEGLMNFISANIAAQQDVDQQDILIKMIDTEYFKSLAGEYPKIAREINMVSLMPGLTREHIIRSMLLEKNKK